MNPMLPLSVDLSVGDLVVVWQVPMRAELVYDKKVRHAPGVWRIVEVVSGGRVKLTPKDRDAGVYADILSGSGEKSIYAPMKAIELAVKVAFDEARQRRQNHA